MTLFSQAEFANVVYIRHKLAVARDLTARYRAIEDGAMKALNDENNARNPDPRVMAEHARNAKKYSLLRKIAEDTEAHYAREYMHSLSLMETATLNMASSVTTDNL